MNVLVIGCNSFSGSVFARFLKSNHVNTFGITRDRHYQSAYRPFSEVDESKILYVKDVSCTNEILEFSRKNEITHVVNFAAQSMVDQSWTKSDLWYETNVAALSRLSESLITLDTLVKFIQFSTPEVYGDMETWQKENWNFNPSTPYAISRAAGDFHLRVLGQQKGFPVVFTRASNVFGPYQPFYRLVPKALISAATKEQFSIEGNGNSIRSFILMEDVARALFLILNHGNVQETYHISTTTAVTTIDIVNLCYGAFGLEGKQWIRFSPERIGKDFRYLLDSSKVRLELGWKEDTDAEEGIRLTAEWVDKNLASLAKLPRTYTN